MHAHASLHGHGIHLLCINIRKGLFNWKTITYAVGYNTPAKPGDTIYVKAGNYGAEYVNFIKSGTDGP